MINVNPPDNFMHNMFYMPNIANVMLEMLHVAKCHNISYMLSKVWWDAMGVMLLILDDASS